MAVAAFDAVEDGGEFLGEGKEATLLLVDGNPLQDVHALSSVSIVLMKGEYVPRRQIFEQK